ITSIADHILARRTTPTLRDRRQLGQCLVLNLEFSLGLLVLNLLTLRSSVGVAGLCLGQLHCVVVTVALKTDHRQIDGHHLPPAGVTGLLKTVLARLTRLLPTPAHALRLLTFALEIAP